MLFFALLFGCAGTTPEGLPVASADTLEQPDGVDEPTLAGIDPNARSGQLALASTTGRSWAANPLGGAVLGFSNAGSKVYRLPLDGEPTRLVRRGSKLWVTLRASGELAELEEDGDGLRVVRRVPVGAEPYDVVASGEHVYVSLSQEGAVVELRRADLSEIRRFPLPGEPRAMALAMDPWTDASLLAVVLERTPTLAVVQLDGGTVALHDLPDARRSDVPGDDDLLVPRVTGEVLWEPFADRLWATGVYVDTKLFSEAAEPDEGGPVDGGIGDACGQPSDTLYGGAVDGCGGSGISRFNPVVFVVDLVSSEELPPRVAGGRGYPTTLELTGQARGASLWLGFEGEERVVHASADSLSMGIGPVDLAVAHIVESVFVPAPASLRAVDREATMVDWSGVAWSRVRRLVRTGGIVRYAPSDGVDEDVRGGMQAFMLATNPTFSARDSGVACGSCHREGRDDGLTWRFADMDRQTPSLAGPVSQTAPLTWIGGVETIAEEATLTATLRMGGAGPTPNELVAVTAFVDAARRPASPRPTASEQAARALGAEVFRRPEVGCADCHRAANGAGAGVVPLFGVPALSIPPLVGVAATAPYLHDGSAATLEDVVERCREGVMGDTSSLSTAEADALVAYLRWFGEP